MEIKILLSDGTDRKFTYRRPSSVVTVMETLVNQTKKPEIRENLEDLMFRSCRRCGNYSRFKCPRCPSIICNSCYRINLYEHKQNI